MSAVPAGAAPQEQAAAQGVLAPTLGGRYYTDPAVLDAECERIFERQWYCAGRADEIPEPGRFIRRRVGRETVLLVRGKDQVIRGFLNVCRHRGSQLCLTGSGSVGNAIHCPYHNWIYGLDGSLITTPNWRAMTEIRKMDYGLHAVKAAVWAGLIWVCIDGDPGPLEDHVRPQIESRLGDYAKLERYRIGELTVGARAEYEVAANWKLIYENFQECYHCSHIHPELVQTIPQFRSPAMGADGYDPDGYPIAADRASFSLTGQTVLPRLPGLLPADDGLYYGMVLRPNCFLSLVSDHVIVHRFEPVARGPDPRGVRVAVPAGDAGGGPVRRQRRGRAVLPGQRAGLRRGGVVPAEHELARLPERRGPGAQRAAGDLAVLRVVPGPDGHRRLRGGAEWHSSTG